MRASPAIQVSLHRFGVWSVAVLLLAVLGVSVIAAWSITREQRADIAVPIAAALAAVAIAWLGVSTARVPAVSLRWDGLLWHLGQPGSMADDSVPGDLAVTIDLGPWMLLRFNSAVLPGRRSQVTWLPVQRRGIEAQWHALRCAVYSPRPVPDAGA